VYNAPPSGSPSPPESPLASSASQAAAKAFERLFRAHYGPLRDYGRRLVARPALVEDAIQEVFLTLWTGATEVDELDAPRSYLLIALRRRLLRARRAEQRRHERDQAFAEGEPAFTLTPEDWIVRSETHAARRDRLAAAIDTLSDRRREAVHLRFYHGLTYREIAGVMAIRAQTIRNYVSEALQHIRDQMATGDAAPVGTLSERARLDGPSSAHRPEDRAD
jgi:RNA polymerase sigma factor (sigma-70 family)